MKNPLRLPERKVVTTQEQRLERIANLQAELDALIDAEAEDRRKQFGLPATVTRRDIELRAPGCQCKQYKAMVERPS